MMMNRKKAKLKVDQTVENIKKKQSETVFVK